MPNKKRPSLHEIMITGIQLGIKFGHIIPPFDVFILERRLLKLGYNIENIRATGQPSIPGKLRLGIMEDLEVSYNSDKQVLTIQGQNHQKIVKSFTDLYDSITELASPIKLNVSFYEMIISAVVKSSKNPLTVFSKSENMFKAIELESLFGQRVSLLGIRLSPSNTEIDNPNWFEYRIEPLIIQPSLEYLCGYIYRSQNMKKTIESLSSFNELTTNLVTMLEG